MTPAEFGAELGWPRVMRAGRLCWQSDRGTCVSVGHYGQRVRVTHRVTGEEALIPLDGCAVDYCRAFDGVRS